MAIHSIEGLEHGFLLWNATSQQPLHGRSAPHEADVSEQSRPHYQYHDPKTVAVFNHRKLIASGPSIKPTCMADRKCHSHSDCRIVGTADMINAAELAVISTVSG